MYLFLSVDLFIYFLPSYTEIDGNFDNIIWGKVPAIIDTKISNNTELSVHVYVSMCLCVYVSMWRVAFTVLARGQMTIISYRPAKFQRQQVRRGAGEP